MPLFQLLQNRIIKLENAIRWNWAEGNLAVWGYRVTQHYAVADYANQFRKRSRVIAPGAADRPAFLG